MSKTDRRPYAILTEVPAYSRKVPTPAGATELIPIYRPFGTNET